MTPNQEIAVACLADLLKRSGADYATETQWRRHIRADHKRLSFQIPDLVQDGEVEKVAICDRRARYGADPKPQAAYRPKAS